MLPFLGHALNTMSNFLGEAHSKLDGVIIGDALFSNAPFIKLLAENDLHYILGVKPGKSGALFSQFEINEKNKLIETLEVSDIIGEKIKKRVAHVFKFLNGLSLNNANPDIKVNMLEYTETIEYVNQEDDKKDIGTKIKKFTWITDIELTKNNVFKIVKSARSRWKIETFQTLKSESSYSDRSLNFKCRG